MGLDLCKLSQLGGHSVKHTHRNPSGPNVGMAIMLALIKKVQVHNEYLTIPQQVVVAVCF